MNTLIKIGDEMLMDVIGGLVTHVGMRFRDDDEDDRGFVKFATEFHVCKHAALDSGKVKTA